MKMETIFEVVKIKQVLRDVEVQQSMRIRSPQDAADIAASFIGDEDREVFLVMCLNSKNQVNAVHRCHVGSINSSIVHPREVFKSAILNNSASIIVAHNHPSQDVMASKEDIEVTRRLVKCGEMMGIEVLDHLVINENAKFFSMKERGHM